MTAGSAPGEHRGGRRKGVPNKRTVEREAVQMRARELLAGVSGAHDYTPGEHAIAAYVDAATATDTSRHCWNGNALAFLQVTYRDPRLPRAMRLDAAKAAIRYESPALAAITLAGDAENPITLRTLDSRTPLDGRLVSLLVHAGVPVTTHDVGDDGETRDTAHT